VCLKCSLSATAVAGYCSYPQLLYTCVPYEGSQSAMLTLKRAFVALNTGILLPRTKRLTSRMYGCRGLSACARNGINGQFSFLLCSRSNHYGIVLRCQRRQRHISLRLESDVSSKAVRSGLASCYTGDGINIGDIDLDTRMILSGDQSVCP
jgi:hypothetical protein